jgi:uncharacterized protein with PQ loop repeat
MYKLIYGWVGTSITIIYKLPQMYKFYNEKTSEGVSIISYGIQTFGYIMYAIHGIIIKDDPCFIMGAVAFFLNLILCCQYFYYRKKIDTVIM